MMTTLVTGIEMSRTKINVLVLGHYHADYKDAGDELYKVAIPAIMNVPRASYIFKPMDDVMAADLDATINLIICGGGAVLTTAFLQRLSNIAQHFVGPIYAFSADLATVREADRKYLNMFDHIFARSRTEYALACTEIGTLNVTHLPDAILAITNLAITTQSSTFMTLSRRQQQRRQALGVALALSALTPEAKASMIDTLALLALRKTGILLFEIHLLSMSYEDYALNQEIAQGLAARGILDFIIVPQPAQMPGPMSMYSYVAQRIDAMVSVHYAGMTLALNLQKPLMALVASPDTATLISDFSSVIAFVTPIADLRSAHLEQLLGVPPSPPLLLPSYRVASDKMLRSKSLATLLQKPPEPWDTPGNIIAECVDALVRYLHAKGVTQYDASQVYVSMQFPRCVDYQEVALLISYCLTRRFEQGGQDLTTLASLLRDSDKLRLHDTMVNTYDAFWSTRQQQTQQETYYLLPRSTGLPIANIDPYFQNDEFKGYHRSGWDYVLRGLASMDAQRLMRCSSMMIDSYLDRTFHWGRSTLEAAGHIPYREPWLGILHHTFYEGHGMYNSTELFRCTTFLNSLATCAGLITLSEYLAVQVRAALQRVGHGNIRVWTLTHPMEPMSAAKNFSMPAFLSNPNRCIIQIGAWMRDPYAIYDLPLFPNNILSMTKAALRGKNMDSYFRPPGLLDEIQDVLFKPTLHGSNNTGGVCRPGGIGICRPGGAANSDSNKYSTGLFDSIVSHDQSVTILDTLPDDAYDDLLGKNIVFLKMVDCSAVNTVLECIMRNVPLLVNRHPALEEVLGSQYPGFYVNLYHAAALAQDLNAVMSMHEYLARSNKSRFNIQGFVTRLQGILLQSGL